MRVDFSLRICLDGKELDEKLHALLDALRSHGSLAAAARSARCSYRYAWDRLRAAEADYGEPLVRLHRGRRAQLSPLGERLLLAQARARAGTNAMLLRLAREAEAELARPASTSPPKLVIAASHDLGLLEFKRFCAVAAHPLVLDVRFRGSLEALSEFAHGRCDLAGFHLGPDAYADIASRRILSQRQHRLIIFADREQGLMVAPGNPKGIAGLRDLGRRGVRFVNRQSGSGTRILFDRLLAASGGSRFHIQGYDSEEFTHLAVAATVASGHADVGFGIHAAAASYRLHFIPMSKETYYLAVRRAGLDREPMRLLTSHLSSATFRRRLARLQGYDASQCGTLADVDGACASPEDPSRTRRRGSGR